MFIAQAIRPGMNFWTYFLKYSIGLMLITVAAVAGQIPFTLAVLSKSMADGNGFNIPADKIMTILEPNLSLFLILLTYVFVLATIFLVGRFLHGQTIRTMTTSRAKIDWNRIFFSFGIWAGFSVVSTLLLYWLYPDDFVVAFQPIPFLILFVIATLLIPVQTAAEEYIFRGYLMQGIGVMARNRWLPLIVTSVFFGGLHFFNPEVGKLGNIIMVYYIGTGLFLGVLTLMDEGMELALGFHAANNLLGALLVTSDWTAFQTYSVFKSVSEPDATVDVLLPVLVIFPILLFIFSRKYGWRDWIVKLTGKIETHTTEKPD
jgi:membrane protease YdiL (CAAX protease family)